MPMDSGKWSELREQSLGIACPSKACRGLGRPLYVFSEKKKNMTCTSDGPVYFNFIQYLPCKRSSRNRARGLAKFVRCNTVSLYRGSFSCISILGCERNRSFYQCLRYIEVRYIEVPRYSWEFLVRVCRPVLPNPISDQIMSFFTPVFRPGL